MGKLQVAVRLPIPGWPRGVVESDYGLRGARLLVEGRAVLEAHSRALLKRGVEGALPGSRHRVSLQLAGAEEAPRLEVRVDGTLAPVETALRAPASRAALIHALWALSASVAGFIASWLYLRKGAILDDAWAHKMGLHTLGWHLLLVVTLFPVSVWGQRLGIRAVQGVSGLFFLIHIGIALANLLHPDVASSLDGWIGGLNAASGALFAVATLYGQRAWRSMDPLAALYQGTATVGGV